MAIHPVAIVEQVIEEYRHYLLTEFRARDPKLRQSLEEALTRSLFLAQDPFFQAHRPFKPGKAWQALGLDEKLATVMEKRSSSQTAYLHQSEAITHLLSEDAGPLIVTTGTGSGKTECFLLPVIQNAIRDAVRYSKQSGLTALLVYPMNALANDQLERIRSYLEESGHSYVKVERYDRSTPYVKRAEMRQSPPHILLTNYMMLEYLLVRPADRDALFANHRCRFVVLDEVHTYRGSLGANIALLLRRFRAHLSHARQDFRVDDPEQALRSPRLIPVATSATIKSVDEAEHPDRSPEELKLLRDEAVQSFFACLAGVPQKSIRVIGEELSELTVPPEAAWPEEPVDVASPAPSDLEAVRRATAKLAGLPEDAPLHTAASSAAILFTLGDLLAKKPRSLRQITEAILAEVPERRKSAPDQTRREVLAALVCGAALPDDAPGALRLRTHRFLRGGWRFSRCVDPECGKLYARGELRCQCGRAAAPLYLCRSCGADTLRFRALDDPETLPLSPNDKRDPEGEWLLYDRQRLSLAGDEDLEETPWEIVGQQMKGRQVYAGSFDPQSGSFSRDSSVYPVQVVLAPARNRCLVCGASVGAGSVLTPVALGTSAAVRVVAEGLVESLARQHHGQKDHDGKERLLIFADSRQDAAHQARFITFAGRYDRMRRRLVRLLRQNNGELTVEEAVNKLMARGGEMGDNPQIPPGRKAAFLHRDEQARARAWEEAPLLDDLAVSASYRATAFNLGLVGVSYQKLFEYIESEGEPLAQRLQVSSKTLWHISRCLLDEMRVRRALSRPLLCYHPLSTHCPAEFKLPADWERRNKTPVGYACDEKGKPVSYLDSSDVPEGVTHSNLWRRPKGGGKSPGMQRKFCHLMERLGGAAPEEKHLLDLLSFLKTGGFLTTSKLFGHSKAIALVQVNAESLLLRLLPPEERLRCSVCNLRLPWSEQDAPCPSCHGVLRPWPEEEVVQNRYVQRIEKDDLLPLVAGEHTAQITGEARITLEDSFKAPPQESPINVLACSPTLEMGIDVGGLDAVVMRNVPPRPDNYAQRGGRAGRRSRVGIVLGYARNTPHDSYFYDKPQEMIGGEVAAPAIRAGNRDVVLRHLAAIVFGLAEPGLSGKMVDYITPTGERNEEAIEELLAALQGKFGEAVTLAYDAWGQEILEPAGLETEEKLFAELEKLPLRIRRIFDRVRRQVLELRSVADPYIQNLTGQRRAIHAMELVRKLLGIYDDRGKGRGEADDRSAGHPMRRFAEFGILPGYEFPSEPATLRLLGDKNEEEPLSVVRRFGIAQYQPEAVVHARGYRWRVVGLDPSSPWNPENDDPSWCYTICNTCKLRFDAQEVRCPRCRTLASAGKELLGYELGGFLAVREDTPVLEDEDRFALISRLRCAPQWNGEVTARSRLATGWRTRLSQGEEVRWINEFKEISEAERKRGAPSLHGEARGFYLCPSCGRMLTFPEVPTSKSRGRKKAQKVDGKDPFGHIASCTRKGKPPTPIALTCSTLAATLRVEVDLPDDMDEGAYLEWGYSLGYALRTGMRHLYMLDGSEVEFELEPMWEIKEGEGKRKVGALTFIDPALGGSGFLDKAAQEMHLVAHRAIEHLDHTDCESACYRCLKSYQNQRHHAYLSWPPIMDHLREIASAPPQPLPLQPGDSKDPTPWLEAYKAGVGSPLELKFLELFQKHGLSVDRQIPVAPEDGAAPISTADFVIQDTRVAIYIDGAAFHVGNRLRRDQIIRKRLREGSAGWQVVELRAKDLKLGAKLVESLKNLAQQHNPATDPWDNVLSLLEDYWVPLAQGLQEAGVPVPDEVDQELAAQGAVTDQRALLFWKNQGSPVALVEEGTEIPEFEGYILSVTPETAAPALARKILEKLT